MNIRATVTDTAESVKASARVVQIERDPLTDLDRFSDTLHRCVSLCERRIATTKKTRKETVAGLEAEKKAERARHENEMSRIATLIAEAKDIAEREIAADTASIDMAKAALAAAPAE
jgi:hypothetical protein